MTRNAILATLALVMSVSGCPADKTEDKRSAPVAEPTAKAPDKMAEPAAAAAPAPSADPAAEAAPKPEAVAAPAAAPPK